MRSSAYAKKSRHSVVYARLVLPELRRGKRHEVQVSTGTKDPREGVARSRFLRVVLERIVAQGELPSAERIIAILRNAMATFRAPPPGTPKFDVAYDQAGRTVVTNVKPGEELSAASFMLAMQSRPPQSLATVAIAPPAPIPAASSIQHPGALGPKSSTPLYAMVKEYLGTLQDKVRTGQLDDKGFKSVRSKLQLFMDYTGNILVGELTQGFVNRFVEDLFYYPIRRDILKVEPTLGIKSLIAAGKAGTLYYTSGEKATMQSPGTVATYAVVLRNFFVYCHADMAIHPNVMERQKIKVPPKIENIGVKREDFSIAELKRIFEDSFMSEPRYNVPHQYWVPLIGLFTGARLSEICQMTKSDIVDMGNGILGFNLTNENEGDSGKSLKTKASKRLIPIHSKILEMGFVAYLESVKNQSGNANLFGLNSAKRDGYGKVPGEWFNDKYLTYLGIKTPGLVFHSLRHTFITRITQSIVEHANAPQSTPKDVVHFPEAYILRKISGHSNRSDFTSNVSKADVHESVYIQGYTAEATQRVLERLQFPTITFSPYQPIGATSRRRTMEPIKPRASRASKNKKALAAPVEPMVVTPEEFGAIFKR